ncbi:uncharacterized protein LOC143376667 [Andrena cerasifolii]|uniref:uncharacterized protein LOC143376667 n=1 Tax=Andrena cerasifolii TaxID=2819439 RepID=UPI0040376149
MNYNGNMPDWHQFNVSQTNEAIPSTQNVNSGHLAFIPGVNPQTLNALNLNSEGLNKHQNDSNYNPRNFQTFNNASSGSNISNNSPLVSMMQMQNCISHYGSPNARNLMLDNLNPPLDHRNSTIATISDEMGYRSNQVPFNGPIGHLSVPSCNLNTSSGPGPGAGAGTGAVPGPGPGPGSRTHTGSGPETSPGSGAAHGSVFGSGARHGPGPVPGSGTGNMGPRNTNIGSIHPGKHGPPSFIPCKGLCCNSDPSMNYQQWEKFGSYQANTSYRDNVHQSGYQMENRHYGNNCNFRKDNLESKETMGPVLPNASAIDHRRNFVDYKYHKDHLTHRNYSTSSGMYHSYPMQTYNYSAEHQKYPYPVKEHSKASNMNVPNSGVLNKHQEQHLMAQQKFNNKQFQYQNGNVLPKGVPALNVSGNMASAPQNNYYNSQFVRNMPTEVSHESQETTDNTLVNRIPPPATFMHNSPQQHQAYQHKIAMQKFSMETHLRELSRIPGYQSHPKYKECVSRYTELLKLQQSAGYQNPVQQSSCVATPINSSAVPPINLQFDQNGMLINSSYPDGFSKLQHAPARGQSSENIDKPVKDRANVIANEKSQPKQQPEQLIIPLQNEHVPSYSIDHMKKPSQFSMHHHSNQNQLKVQTSEAHGYDTLNTDNNSKTMMHQKASKEFANKPDLDVRQFLANWDETDDEEGTTSNLPESVLSETTPVVVVSYENVDLSPRTSQSTEAHKRSSFCPSEATADNEKEGNGNGNGNAVQAKDCLTVSYPSPESAEIVKASKRTIAEGVVKPGSIIHCISNGPDEIPTIHIVDNLEISNILGASNDQVAESLDKQKTISFFKDTANSKPETMPLQNAKRYDKNEAAVLPVKYDNAPLAGQNKGSNIQHSSISETIRTATVVSVTNNQAKTNLEITDDLAFKKQNHFSSEESHNPDDISLPDLPTSECTPISTTLNTPIHSDSEESSQNIEDLSMSTNPIEVMQNSPVISFTQSPVKMEPYGQLSTEDKLKDRSLDPLELELEQDQEQCENCYETDTNSTHEQDISLDSFDFSVSDPTMKSSDVAKEKQINLTRKKVFLVNGKENDPRISDTCAALTSLEYQLEVGQKAKSEENSECESMKSVHEQKHKGTRSSTNSMQSAIQSSKPVTAVDNFVDTIDPTASHGDFTSHAESDDETEMSTQKGDLAEGQKVKGSTRSIHTTEPSLASPEAQSNRKQKIKGTVVWEDKLMHRSLGKLIKAQKTDTEHRVKQPKSSDARKFSANDLCLSQNEEHSVCHTASRYKNYTVAVIKDNVILSDKKSHGTAEKNLNIRCEKSADVQLRANNTKEHSEEEGKNTKHTSSKHIPTSHENVHSRGSKKSEVPQKDLKIVDEGGVRLKEYRKKKDRLHQARNTHGKHCTNYKEHSLKTAEEGSSKGNDSSFYRRNNKAKHTHSKGFVKNVNSDFGIQVANVNLKINESEIGKELILGDKAQDPKDSLDRIKIEINVSCTERNSKGQEQNKQLLKLPLYEIDDSLPYSITTYSNNAVDGQHHRVHADEQETDSNLIISNRITEEPVGVADDTIGDAATLATDSNMSTVLQKAGRNPLEANERALTPVTFKETCNLASESQALSNLLRNNVPCKDTSGAEVIEGTNYFLDDDDDTDTIKSNCAISSTAIVDANNKMLIKMRDKLEGEDGSTNTEKSDHVAGTQKQSCNSGASSSQVIIGGSIRNDEKKVAIASHVLENIKKLRDVSILESSATSLNSVSALDLNFDKLDYKKCSNANADHVHGRVNEPGELDDSYMGKWRKPKIDNIFEDCEMFQSTSGYINPIFSSINKLDDLHTVPVYTTKDGKISYSPNRKFTYHELMMEARKREGSSSIRKPYCTDAWSSYYSSRFRRFYKRKRHHDLSDKRKHDFQDMKYLYERRRNYLDEFYGRSNHVKHKDYVHSIKNNNAVWSDHCKMNRMYSSSESDEEIMNHGKSCSVETSNYKRNCTVETKATAAVPALYKSETIIDDLAMRNEGKEGTASDANSRKDKATHLVEMQLDQSPFVDNKADNEDCQSAAANNSNENIEKITESKANESSMPAKSRDYIIENIQLNDEYSTSRDQQGSFVCYKKEVSARGESSSSKSPKNVSSLKEDDRTSNSRALEENENNGLFTFNHSEHLNKSFVDIKAFDNQTPIGDTADNFQNTSQITESEFLDEIDEIGENNCPPAKEIPQLHRNPGEMVEPESQTCSKLEDSSNTPTRPTETFSRTEISQTPERILAKAEKSIFECECEEKSIRIIEDAHSSKVAENREESADIEFLECERNGSPKETSESTYTNQEESESHVAQIDTTDKSNVKYISSKYTESLSTSCKEADTLEADKFEDSIFPGVSKDTEHIEGDNTIENSILNTGNEIEIAVANVMEIPTEESTFLLDKEETNRSGEVECLVETEMPVLSSYCAIKESPAESIEYKEDEIKENAQKEEECQSPLLESYKSLGHSSEGNTDIKAVPKLVIKKTDHLNPKSECSLDHTESENPMEKRIDDTKLLTDVRPKIPKMIIMKSRSRSVTPTTEILEKNKSGRTQSFPSEHTDTSMSLENSDSELYTLKYNNYESKVPRVKIKLEDISSKDLKLYLKRKATKKSIPKMRIKKIKTQESRNSATKTETDDNSEMEPTDCDNDDDDGDKDETLQELLPSDAEKVPRLKFKRQEEDDDGVDDERSLVSPDSIRENTSLSKVPFRKSRKTREEDTRNEITDEIKNKYPQSITEKIPKVIIKRTQIGAEFKCEISKSKKTLATETSAMWQPKVKLQRLQMLDYMVKDLKQSRVTLKDKSLINAMVVNVPVCVKDDINDIKKVGSCDDRNIKLCRSSSASNLSPVKYKQRRLSDCDYMKANAKSSSSVDFVSTSPDGNKHRSLDKNKVPDIDATENENNNRNKNKNSKEKGKRRAFSRNKVTNDDLNGESEDEIRERTESNDTRESSFRNFLINNGNDLVVEKKECSSFGAKGRSTSTIGDNFRISGIIRSSTFDDNGNSIIKVDSSDESQTTIEILAASPDSSEDEEQRSKNNEFENISRLHIDDAIPTQLELELELIDNNNVQGSSVAAEQLAGSDIEKYELASHSRNGYTNEESAKAYFRDLPYSLQNTSNQDKFLQNKRAKSPEKRPNDYFYCNDLLVKEVLAAKETLKKCLIMEKRKSRPKTLAEKKQGLSFNFKDLQKSYYKSENESCNYDNESSKLHSKCANTEKKEYKSGHKRTIEETEERLSGQDKYSSIERRMEVKHSRDEISYPTDCPAASTCGYTSISELHTISLKASKKFGQCTMNEASPNIGADNSDLSTKHNTVHNNTKKSGEEKPEEKRTIDDAQDQKDSSSERKSKEDNMPLLVPEFALNFDSNSDRDSSRSPPVITNQDEVDNAVEDVENMKSKVIIPMEKVEENEKHSYEDCEMTIADIITQLAYHEKATIKHKRYCNLCERWFPTTARHQRHLAGYQHRYMELSQRKSIHTLFILFTGKPCPKLLPANMIRNDCSIGELTPLQIAVQDIAKYVEHTQLDVKTKE